jgi:AcrR family transcriptional regulator
MPTTALRKPRKLTDSKLWATRQEEILDAAVRLFAEHGYGGTDTQLLADELGVGKGTLYRYFPSKEKLFLAAVDRLMRRFLEYVESRLAGIEDPLEQISTGVRAYLTFLAENPEFVELLMQERARFKDRKKPTYFEYRDANAEKWRARYRGLIAAGRLRSIPVERIRDVMGQLLYGTMFINYFTAQAKSVETQAEDILDVMFNGILSNTERQKVRGQKTEDKGQKTEDRVI